MLSDRDRRMLRELEHRLVSEDPDFARSFAARARRLPGAPRGRAGIRIFLLAGLALSALVLVAGSIGGAMAFAGATVLIWLMWWSCAEGPQQAP